ncbi:hypothetical protein HPB48_022916 [Haemaphysalis longicornis]|uniref:THAP-type domain-containing protein n=1 Tax=Haemaphysalis longicornis TaxID=44386 RepID=A0A9J6FR02_HAELO|nr:hypothetical protein HPB48_022916 [Haemaphysalis longicornis]
MPPRCVAYGCSNSCATPNTSLHKFPKCVKLRKLWTLAVRRHKWEPTNHGVLCSAHFREEDFHYNPSLNPLVGCKQMKRLLKPRVVPSVFLGRSTQVDAPARSAFKKRRHIEVSKHSQFLLNSKCDHSCQWRYNNAYYQVVHGALEAPVEAHASANVTRAQLVVRAAFDNAVKALVEDTGMEELGAGVGSFRGVQVDADMSGSSGKSCRRLNFDH